MNNIFHHGNDYADVGPDWIDRLKKTALESPLRRARLCLHASDDDLLHEMVIALTRDCLFPPHRHPFKSESYQMIDGRMILIIFTDDGVPERVMLLTPYNQGGLVCFRLSAPAFHAVLPIDDTVVFHEATNGPFKRGEAILAPWAPTEDAKLRIFLENAAITGGIAREMLVPGCAAKLHAPARR